MRIRSSLALVTAAAVAAALFLAPSSAYADSATFTNPTFTNDSGDLHIPTMDVKYNTSTLTVTLHAQNFVGPGYDAQFIALDGPITNTSGKLYAFVSSTPTGPDATVTSGLSATSGTAGATSTADTSGVTITSNIAAGTVTFTVPSSHIFWSGPVYIIAGITDHSDSDNASIAQALGGIPAIGLGPVTSNPSPTVTAVTLTSATQVYGSTPTVIIASVSPVAAGTVSLLEGSTVLTTAPVTPTGIAILIVPSKLASGAHSLTAQFTPTDSLNLASSTSASVGVTVISVAKATKTTVSLSKKTQTYKKKGVKVSVSLSNKAAGAVTVFDGKKKLKTLTLKKGKASYTLSKSLKQGTHRIKVVYTPKDVEAFKKSTSKTLVLKVKK